MPPLFEDLTKRTSVRIIPRSPQVGAFKPMKSAARPRRTMTTIMISVTFMALISPKVMLEISHG
jgi:hypothetical protein